MRAHRDEELQEALDTLDMESWLDSEGIKYRPTMGSSGRQLNVRECPVCGSSKYKVFLNADTGLGNCFSGSCEKKFNRWSFIKATLGDMPMRDIVERIKRAARSQGWRPPKKTAVAVNLDTELILPESHPLPIKGRNLKYLDQRGITHDITRYFGLRYSAEGVFRYKDEHGRDLSQSYAKRVIIPIFNLEGDLVSFQGRDITGTADKKYLFPPGFASTGSVLYNGQNALGAEHVVVGEGVFDVMAIKMALEGQMELRDHVAIGSFGKHLSHGDESSQMGKLLELKERGLKYVTFMWDSESQALSDAADAALLLKGYGFETRVAVLPKGRDPNEVPASSVREAFWKALPANAMTMVKLKLMAAAM